jgi:hypothetical protein
MRASVPALVAGVHCLCVGHDHWASSAAASAVVRAALRKALQPHIYK